MHFARARELLAQANAAGAFSAAVVEVGGAAGPRWREAFGRLSRTPGDAPTTVDTIFDLASLTKVIATTAIAMRLVGRGLLDLDAAIGLLLPSWRQAPCGAARVRQLLDHSSGLPAHARLWARASGRLEFAQALRSLPLERAPAEASVYSDPGFMVLGLLLEAVGGAELDAGFDPLAEHCGANLGYLPDASSRDRTAATEFDPWRNRLLRGEVHDENAAAMGGVAGHAGLFGSAVSVGAFARLVLRTFRETTALGTPDLMRMFSEPSAVPGSSRALGWDTMRPTSSCGTLLSPTAIGHTGFTGTSLWIDRERDLYVVLLSNRVHPTRTNEAFVALRPRIHDAIVQEEA